MTCARGVPVHAKVCAITADIPVMEDEPHVPFGPGHPRYLQARALALSVAAIRKAQGKKNPDNYPIGSPGWLEVDEDFARDVLRALGGDFDNLNHDFT
jgi:hypothetical protein